MMRSLLVMFSLVLVPAWAGDLSSLTQGETGKGLKEALVQGAEVAVGKLSVQDGFLGNPKVKIPLPPALAKAEKMLRTVGLQKPADELVTTMNRAAESAVVEAKPILMDSIRKMTLEDAKAILTGPEDSATQYFRKSSGAAITLKFKPKVAVATRKVKLAKRYDKVAGQAAALGLIEKENANLDDYVTQKAVDGLFLMIADQEKAIRKDPIGQASSLLRKVFGAAKS
ncbi:DUF4197 domain-containing protein [Holophaga foetida]|uniref:DUF4197 domain-containing protein n=1 Tax=Holophaga foetida TaxID=35839 RepID=UPI0002473792|nr:DUF4197 domain-containing protein [Holophaga foetida]